MIEWRERELGDVPTDRPILMWAKHYADPEFGYFEAEYPEYYDFTHYAVVDAPTVVEAIEQEGDEFFESLKEVTTEVGEPVKLRDLVS